MAETESTAEKVVADAASRADDVFFQCLTVLIFVLFFAENSLTNRFFGRMLHSFVLSLGFSTIHVRPNDSL